jgi:transmembrane sensor
MPWKQHFFNKNGSKESVCKERHNKYYFRIYIPVQYLIRDQNKADEITCHTLLQVCCHSTEHTDTDLFALMRRIAIGKCFEHIKNNPRLADEHREYLSNNEDSADLLEALFNCAQRCNNELSEWKQLSATQQEKMILDCTPPTLSSVRFNKWSELLEKYRDRNITGAEEKELFQQAARSNAKQAQYKQFADPEEIVKHLKRLNEIDMAREYERFKKQLGVIRQPDVYYYRIIAAACLVYFVLAIAFFTFNRAQPSPGQGSHPLSTHNWVPGTGPELIFQNGTVIKLDSIRDGVPIASGYPFMKKGSTLVYVPLLANGQEQRQGINILSIPPRRQYHITLADGSEINLNASSQLHFPINFSKNERLVKMEGEAFFHVNANKAKPFFVQLKDSVIVTVLGTSFNIDAHNKNDYIKTTLIEGSLKITANRSGESKLLRPGQQAHFAKGNLVVNDKLNVDHVMAWKEGRFVFDHKSIPEIMEAIGPWYNVNFIYRGGIPTGQFSASFNRSSPLTEVIKILSIGSGIHMEIKVDTIIVSSHH